MRRLVPIALLLAALIAPAAAHATDYGITLSDSGFDKTQVVIKPGDSVTFTNNSTLTLEAVQFDDETGPRCSGLNTDCSRTFPAAGQFKFFDPSHSTASGSCTSYDTCDDPYRGIVIVDGPPSVRTFAGPGSAIRGADVAFSATADDPNGDTVSAYNWDFGDGTTTSTPTGDVSHAYATAGSYTATVTATDSRGNVSAPSTVGITIVVPDTDGDGFDDDHDNCVRIPGVAPDGCPPVVPPIATAAVAAKMVGLQGALKSGLAVVVKCSSACTAQLDVLEASAARRAQLPEAYASGTVTIPSGGGSKLVTLQFTTPAKAALARLVNPKLKLRVSVTDELGRVQTRESSITLSQVKTVGKLPAIGISDQQAATFADPLFQVLKLKFARLVTPWNSIYSEPDRLDGWLQAARALGARPLVSFEHKRSDQCPQKPCKAPSVAQYKRAWLAFHRKYPWVRDISPWNEANSSTQPTGKRPDLAAAYYNVVRATCRGCTIVAADVLDLNNMRRYVKAFLAKAKGKPRLWGLHNYRDTNRFRQTGTKQLLATVKGNIWFTETGGIVKFTTQSGKKALPTSESRAKRAMDYMFRLAEIDAKRVKRIYVYQWKVNFAGDRFDAGVVRPDGTPRPSFDVLTLNASIARKR